MYDSEDGSFYIVVNKYQEKLGFYVCRFDERNIESMDFLVRWQNKLDIDNCHLNMTWSNAPKGKSTFKELIIGFKQIFVNTYNIFVIDITLTDRKPIQFHHEIFQQWESDIYGFILKNNDYIILNKSGINVISLATKATKREITDHNGAPRVLHSLESCAFLKLDPWNHL